MTRLPAAPYAVHFLQQAPVEGPREVMDDLLVGRLVLDGGCLYVDDEDLGTRILPVWPSGYSLADVDGRIVILDGSWQTVVGVGARIVLNGGAIPDVDGGVEESGIELPEPLPEECSGQLWLGGGVVGWLAD